MKDKFIDSIEGLISDFNQQKERIQMNPDYINRESIFRLRLLNELKEVDDKIWGLESALRIYKRLKNGLPPFDLDI